MDEHKDSLWPLHRFLDSLLSGGMVRTGNADTHFPGLVGVPSVCKVCLLQAAPTEAKRMEPTLAQRVLAASQMCQCKFF